MTSFGNSVRDDQQLRELQELIAKLKDVDRQLALPRTAHSLKQAVVVDAPLLAADAADAASA